MKQKTLVDRNVWNNVQNVSNWLEWGVKILKNVPAALDVLHFEWVHYSYYNMLNSIFALNILVIKKYFNQNAPMVIFFPFLRFVLLKANILLQKFLQEVFLRNQNASNSRCPMLAAAGKNYTLPCSAKIVKKWTKTPKSNFLLEFSFTLSNRFFQEIIEFF